MSRMADCELTVREGNISSIILLNTFFIGSVAAVVVCRRLRRTGRSLVTFIFDQFLLLKMAGKKNPLELTIHNNADLEMKNREYKETNRVLEMKLVQEKKKNRRRQERSEEVAIQRKMIQEESQRLRSSQRFDQFEKVFADARRKMMGVHREMEESCHSPRGRRETFDELNRKLQEERKKNDALQAELDMERDQKFRFYRFLEEIRADITCTLETFKQEHVAAFPQVVSSNDELLENGRNTSVEDCFGGELSLSDGEEEEENDETCFATVDTLLGGLTAEDLAEMCQIVDDEELEPSC